MDGPGPALDVVIPVYNEGGTIRTVLDALAQGVKTPFRVLVCYDREEDTTLSALRSGPLPCEVVLVRNRAEGPHAAVLSGFEASRADAVLMWPADDTFNAGIVDRMVALCREGCDVVTASRFSRGGRMEGCPPVKYLLVRVASFTLFHLARLPTRDATNGLRLFSRRVLDTLAVESTRGFAYSIELLVKCHRMGWRTADVPAVWIERAGGRSRFRILRWLPDYLRWYAYAFATTCLRRGPDTVARAPTADGTTA